MKNINTPKNQIILMTSDQLQELVREIQEVKALVKATSSQEPFQELLRTSDVKRMLKMGESTLAGLRQNGTLPFTKIGGSIYYFKKDLVKIINDNYSVL